jgi:hypothetical protein
VSVLAAPGALTNSTPCAEVNNMATVNDFAAEAQRLLDKAPGDVGAEERTQWLLAVLAVAVIGISSTNIPQQSVVSDE